MSSPVQLPIRGRALGAAPQRTRRSYGLAALGVILIAGGALISATLYVRNAGEAVLAVSRPIALGHVFQADDLAVVHVAVTDGSVDRIRADDENSVLGRTAAVPLLAGELVGRRAVGAAVTVPAGDAVVGIALKRGQFPIGLTAGEAVWVQDAGADLSTPGVTEAAGPVPATVLATEAVADDPEGTTIFSLLLQDSQSARVTQLSAAGHASLALVPTSP